MTALEVQVPEGLAPRGGGESTVDERTVAQLDLRIIADAVVVLRRGNRRSIGSAVMAALLSIMNCAPATAWIVVAAPREPFAPCRVILATVRCAQTTIAHDPDRGGGVRAGHDRRSRH